ncbi:MAG: hypothetical protein U5J99_04825 [Parvularculaceae bacterium]|nr:hypothetical protein [Parvularculaceae bacterium]
MLRHCLTGVSAFALALSFGAAASAAKPEMAKLGDALAAMYEGTKTAAEPGVNGETAREDLSGEAAPALRRKRALSAEDLFMGNRTADGYVIIDAVAAGNASDLAATMRSLGARNVAQRGRVVSGQMPIKQLETLAVSTYLAFASPALAKTNVGLTTSQGDRSMRSDTIRQRFGIDGAGMTVGVLSDSFSCATETLAGGPFTTQAEDIANNDLPPNVTILKDLIFDGCIDEGRAMAQLIHDVAPGANIAFYTAFDGQADFANGIVALAKAGADVIVDDVIYFAEPMFQDGIIAQAADEVARLGVPYYSSAGNDGRTSFQGAYRAVDTGDGVFHDFDDGPGVDTMNAVVLDGSLQTNLVLNWDSPNFSVSGGAGAQNDVDVIMFDENGERVVDCFPGGVFEFPANGLCQFQFTDGGLPLDGGAGGDAIELVSLVDFIGGSTVNIGLEAQSGAAPGFVKFNIFGGGFLNAEYAVDDGPSWGHSNAAGAESVAAAAFFLTEEFIGDPATLQLRANAGEPPCAPACLNDFSSAGGTPIFFNVAGRRLRAPQVRLKPGITGPDGGNTSFFFNDTGRDDDDGDGVFQTGEAGEFPNFFGTSASAPHVAAIATLLLDGRDSSVLRPREGGGIDFRMCPPDARGRRNTSANLRFVAAADVEARIAEGFLLGPCDRAEPRTIYNVMRRTAQNMTVRASLGDGSTIQTFDEGVVPGSPGFDFDSGFGFVDGFAAIQRFIPSLRQRPQPEDQ